MNQKSRRGTLRVSSSEFYRGLRTGAQFWRWLPNTDADGSWTETYGYEADRDFLISVNYGDGSGTRTWTYDPAGNRASDSQNPGVWAYDNLNIMTDSPFGAYEQHLSNRYADPDVLLGRRKWLNYANTGMFMARYQWDEIGRLTSYTPYMYEQSLEGAAYSYRADGMRVRKVGGINMHWQEPDGGEAGFYIYSSNLLAPTWRYFYDGQMMQEEDKTVPAQGGGAPVITGTSYGLGARGVDRIRPFSVSIGTRTNGVRQYPVYDGHGNMILTLTRDGTNFAQDNKRTYDVWGTVRSGSGPATHRYCANLGHVQDPESDLVYMRARYYEPWTGRFISEDPARDGANWFVYCGNEPVGRVDPDGRDWVAVIKTLVQIFLFFAGAQLLNIWSIAEAEIYRLTKHIAELETLLKAGIDVAGDREEAKRLRKALEANKALLRRATWISRAQTFLKILGYMMIIKAFLMDIDYGSDRSGLDILSGN